MDTYTIQPLTFEHLHRYAEIYAAAFAGPPWNDPWRVEGAEIHVREIMEMKQSFGLELVTEGEVAGIILGSSTLFYNGRSFEINDVAVAPEYQKTGFCPGVDGCVPRGVEAEGHR